MSAAVVVFSGGMDSTVCLALARRDFDGVVALTVDYGQRHRVEVDHASQVAARYGVEHVVMRLELSRWGGSALTDPSLEVPERGDGDTAVPITYVPARNLVFLSLAVGLSEARDADAVYLGVNALDYSGYPDCRPAFLDAFRSAAALGTKRGVEGRPVELRTPLVDLTKAEIVGLGFELACPLELTWSCYRGGARPCGSCDACHLRAKGFAEAGLPDPALG